jgi:DNA polymerase-3 subunit gamma/tau
MSYLVLARKWRPKTFADVTGQSHVVRALTNALSSGRVHHAFLFAGTRGVGKTTIARIFAKALNCEAGVSAEPCGKCGACVSLDEGRFVDLIEVDAASRTGVDDMRDLLDNVQYTPTSGRFKVYLIDEVHMLSKQSFNALLKTLEEPPPHVKFLFATTDPQKLPVTVLSRCLQFNLKRLSTKEIVDRMSMICAEEGLDAEPAALTRLGRAAAGSMRDGLSLLDQALAYGADKLVDSDVAAMLGSMDRHRIIELLDGLADGDGPELLARIGLLDELVPDYEVVLDELATALQRIAVIQIAGPDAIEDEDDMEALQRLAETIEAERLQLFYQIAVTSRRDIGLAPDPRIGFEMAMIRMLAFRPLSPGDVSPGDVSTGDVSAASTGNAAKPAAAARAAAPPAAKKPSRRSKAAAPESPPAPVASSAPAPADAGGAVSPEEMQNWPVFATTLALDGAARQLAENSAVESSSPFELQLGVERRNEHLLTDNLKARVAAAVQARAGGDIAVRFRVTEARLETPAGEAAMVVDAGLRKARDTIANDPEVQQLVDIFDAEVVPDSVRPVQSDE